MCNMIVFIYLHLSQGSSTASKSWQRLAWKNSSSCNETQVWVVSSYFMKTLRTKKSSSLFYREPWKRYNWLIVLWNNGNEIIKRKWKGVSFLIVRTKLYTLFTIYGEKKHHLIRLEQKKVCILPVFRVLFLSLLQTLREMLFGKVELICLFRSLSAFKEYWTRKSIVIGGMINNFSYHLSKLHSTAVYMGQWFHNPLLYSNTCTIICLVLLVLTSILSKCIHFVQEHL